MQHIAQINYNAPLAQMFARLAQNMLNEELVAGPPSIFLNRSNQNCISQLYGQCPSTSGSFCTLTQVGEDLWHITYDNDEVSATLAGPEINKFFTGDF